MATKTLERLQVLISADGSQLSSGLNTALDKVSKAGKKIQGVGRSLSRNVTAPIVGIGAAAVGAAVKTGRLADELLDLSDMTGLTTDQLQEYRRVTNQAGVDTDVVAKAAQQMTLRFSRGAEGSADLRQGLADLGISAKDASGNVRPMSQIVDEAITALSGMEDETQRNILATKLFSRGANDLAPVLALGADEIARLRGEAHDLGIVLSEDQLEAANAFRQEWDSAKQTLAAAGAEIGVALIPVMQKLIPLVQEKIVPAIQRFAEGVGKVDPKLLAVVAAVGAAAAAIGPLLIAIGAIVAAINPVTLAIAAVVVAIGGLTAAWAAWGDDIKGALSDAWMFVKETVQKIVDLFKGPLEAAMRPAIRAAELVTGAFKKMKDLVVGNSYVPDMVEEIGEWMSKLDDVLVGRAEQATGRTALSFSQMAEKISAAVDAALKKIMAFVREAAGSGLFGKLLGAGIGFLTGGPEGAIEGFGGDFGGGGGIGGRPGGRTGGPDFGTPRVATASGVGSPSSANFRFSFDAESIPPLQLRSPEALAVDTWYRRLISEALRDAKVRGAI